MNINNKNKDSTINYKIKRNLKNNNKIKSMTSIRQTTQNKKDNILSKQDLIKNLKSNLHNLSIKYIKELLEKKDFEINSLSYIEALKLDKRNFFQYYFSLLKYSHPLISSSFCTYDDYNSKIIKIFLFFFFFSSDLTINALFFNDDTMHKIYKDR